MISNLSYALNQLKFIEHRDIKPSNIIYIDGKFCLSDSGIIKVTNSI